MAHRNPKLSSVTLQALAAADPLSAQAVLPPTAASEIVKAARAYLQEPTRPVTPAEPARHLLQSSCSYSNRPQTASNFVNSHDFLSAASSDGICWASGGSRSGCADIWTADGDTYEASTSSTWSDAAAQQTSSQHDPGAPRGGSRRTTVSAPMLQPLPGISRASTNSNSSSRGRAASAAGSIPGPRLSELSSLAPLRPSTALKAADGISSGRPPLLPGLPEATAASASADLSSWQQGSSCVTAPPEAAGAWLIPAERSGSVTAAAAREASTSTESSSVIRPLSGGGGPESRCSTPGGSCTSRSRLSSRGGDKPAVRDSLSAAETELDQMLLEADSAAEGGGGVQQQLQDQQQLQEGKASGRLQWQQDVLRVLRHIKTLSLSPGDAPALLSCCTELQCLLATASDWGYLQDWLYTSPGLGTGVAGPAPLAAAAASMQEASSTAAADVQLQPVLRRSLGSSRTCSTAGQQDSPAGALSQDLRAEVLQTLLRLVDSKKPDVLVKVGAILLNMTPASSNVLLSATKMLYGLSKDSSNDSRFRHHGVLRPLLQMAAGLSTVLEQQQQQQQQPHVNTALLYCSGCLKNVSADATNQKSLGRLGGVATMAQVLLDQVSIAQSVASAQQRSAHEQPVQRCRHPQHEAAAQIAVQASAVLRNLSVAPGNAVLFVQQQGLALQALVSLLQPFQQDPEVLLNASRCLSKLSMYDSCREALLAIPAVAGQQCDGSMTLSRTSCQDGSAGSRTGTPGGSRGWASSGGGSGPGGDPGSQPSAVGQMVRALLGVQTAYPKKWATGIRLAFCLGQLTSYHPESRPQVAAVPGALDALPRLVLDLVGFSQLQEGVAGQLQEPQGQQRQQQSHAGDYMIKLLRVLANLSIDRTVGPALAAKQVTADALMAVVTGYQYAQAEELVLNATAALTNLAFYDTPSNKVLQSDADTLLASLLPLLTSGNEESMCEAARAAGNLARASPAVRAALVACDDQHQQQDEEEGAGTASATASARAACSSDSRSSSSRPPSAGPYVLQGLVLLLDHGSWEVVAAVAGALVNLAALAEAGAALRHVGLAAALAGALQRVQEWSHGVQDEQHEEEQEVCDQAAELLLQCVGNMVTCSAAAVSEAILGLGGARCAELSCSSEDLASFSTVVSACTRETAKKVQERLASLWGM